LLKIKTNQEKKQSFENVNNQAIFTIGCMTEQLPPAQTCPLGGASD
jgi:hypothetical protein